MQDSSITSVSFCDFSDSTTEGSIAISKRDICPAAPSDYVPASTIRSPLLQRNAPRLDVDWSDSPPLSACILSFPGGISLRFSGIFSEADLEADTTRQTHQSRSVSLDMSYDIQTFPNIKDVVPDFGNDSDISEVVLMSQKLPATLSTIPEAVEPSPVLTYTTSLSDFDVLNLGTTTETGTSVMMCKRKRTGRIYTIRCRPDHFPWTEQDILETLRDLGAPFLPHLRSSFKEDGRIHLVLDHFPDGSLRNLVDKAGTLSSQRVIFYASEIIVGISNLHSIGVMHRNINPDDIMFDQSGHLVISNFESAEFVASSGLNTGAFSCDFLTYPRVQCYQAPEILLGWAHDSAVDCWGFGMVLYFMYFGKHPFKLGAGPEGSEDLQARVIEGTLSPDSLRLIHPQTRDLILKCIERNPRIRLTVDEIKRHTFFSTVSWAKVADKLIEVPPLLGSFEHPGRDARNSIAHNPVSPSSNPLGVIQLAPVQVQPLRIEKKGSKSPIAPPVDSAVASSAPWQSDTERGTGIHSPKPRTYKPLLPTDMQSKDLKPASGAEIWDILDKEAHAATTLGTAQSGKGFLSFLKPKKSRNYNITTSNSNRVSSMYPRNLFLNFSTASFSWKKSRQTLSGAGPTGSTPNVAISYSRPESLDLPVGLEQIGSGIGFSYNLPPAICSKASICSATPRSCHNIFGTRFTTTTATTTHSATTAAAHSTGQATGACASRALAPLAINGLACPNAGANKYHSSQPFQTDTPACAGSGPRHLLSLFKGGDSDDRTGNGHLGLKSPRSGLATTYSSSWLPPMQQGPNTFLGNAARTTSSSPESDDGPFTPTAVACEEPGGVGVGGDSSQDFDLTGGTLEGKIEPDLTLRLVPPVFVSGDL